MKPEGWRPAENNMPTLPEMVSAFNAICEQAYKKHEKLWPQAEKMAELICLRCLEVRICDHRAETKG